MYIHILKLHKIWSRKAKILLLLFQSYNCNYQLDIYTNIDTAVLILLQIKLKDRLIYLQLAENNDEFPRLFSPSKEVSV